jgi:AcrR family transcriptional regulator
MPKESPSKGEETRGRVVEAAYNLFLDKGYAGTSIRDIAEASGLTIGGIYGHFKNKEEIWSAVFEAKHPYHQMLPLLQAAQGDTIEALLRDTVYRFLEALNQREDILNLMFIELVEFKGAHIESLAYRLTPSLVEIGQKFLSKQDQLRPITPVGLARTFASLFFMYQITDLFMPVHIKGNVDPQTSLEEFIDIYLHGILADGPAVQSKQEEHDQ